MSTTNTMIPVTIPTTRPIVMVFFMWGGLLTDIGGENDPVDE